MFTLPFVPGSFRVRVMLLEVVMSSFPLVCSVVPVPRSESGQPPGLCTAAAPLSHGTVSGAHGRAAPWWATYRQLRLRAAAKELTSGLWLPPFPQGPGAQMQGAPWPP